MRTSFSLSLIVSLLLITSPSILAGLLRQQTPSPSPSCTDLLDQASCVNTSGCSWFHGKVGSRSKSRVFHYGCRATRFCEFTRGSVKWRQRQCSALSLGDCEWKNKSCVSKKPGDHFDSTPQPVFLPSPSSVLCGSFKDPKSCQRNDYCSWVTKHVCIKDQCETFQYGCHRKNEYCDFHLGTRAQRREQCDSEGDKCLFRKDRECVFRHVSIWSCNNLCWFKARDGVCDDGEPGSKTSWCPKGFDCHDCSIRHYTFAPSAPGS